MDIFEWGNLCNTSGNGKRSHKNGCIFLSFLNKDWPHLLMSALIFNENQNKMYLFWIYKVSSFFYPIKKKLDNTLEYYCCFFQSCIMNITIGLRTSIP